MRTILSITAMSLALLLPALARGEQPTPTAPTGAAATSDPQAASAMSLKGSTLVGMKVHNHQQEELGKIEDLVLDTKTGQIRYAALSFGGFLGLGDKLFAVPWDSIQVREQPDSEDFVAILNVDKEQLKNAPGFDKDHWPNFADTQWASDNDRFYTGARPKDSDVK